MELNKELLTELYINQRLSTKQIADKLDLTKSQIQTRLNKFQIKKRTISESRKGIKFTKEHCLNISKVMTGKKGELSPSWKGHFLKYCLTCNKEFEVCLSEHEQGLDKYCSCECYAESLKGNHISSKTEFKKGKSSWLKNKHIQTNTGRTHFKKGFNPINKGKKMPQTSGENHWNWQGGKTELTHLIRQLLEYTNWRHEIFQRDNYTCQECGIKNGQGKTVYLEVHHKKEFSILFLEFLQEYNQFSPIDDKETLVRLAMNWKPFWNIDNGKTLCEECHNLTKKGAKHD